MDLDFTGKNVLIVGGSSGIGLSCAQAFAARGASVAITGTRASKAAYGEGAPALEPFIFSTLNVATPGAVEAWPPPFGALDVVILSQGAVQYRRQEFEAEAFRQVVEVNLNSLMACAQKLAPGLIATKMTEVTTSDPARLHERLKGIPLNRLGRPEEIAAVAMFLASPLAAYIVGETIVVDGGRTLS